MTCLWEIVFECKKHGTPTKDGEAETRIELVAARTFFEAIEKSEKSLTGYLKVAVVSARRIHARVIE